MIMWRLKNKTILKANKKHLLNIIKRTFNRVIFPNEILNFGQLNDRRLTAAPSDI